MQCSAFPTRCVSIQAVPWQSKALPLLRLSNARPCQAVSAQVLALPLPCASMLNCSLALLSSAIPMPRISTRWVAFPMQLKSKLCQFRATHGVAVAGRSMRNLAVANLCLALQCISGAYPCSAFPLHREALLFRGSAMRFNAVPRLSFAKRFRCGAHNAAPKLRVSRLIQSTSFRRQSES